jgi:RNA polymerase sigma-70 factor (ECF subfamily)
MADAVESALIRKCQAANGDAFRELMEKYQRRVYWIAFNLLGHHDNAREIAQEAFIRVFRNIARFDVKKNFYTWIYQITVNLSIDRMRKASHGKTVDIEGIGGLADPRLRDPIETGERTEDRARVYQMLDRLPPRYKTVLILRDIQGLSCGEISEIVGCTNATVRWRLHRARKLFKTLWEGRGVEIEDDPDVVH